MKKLFFLFTILMSIFFISCGMKNQNFDTFGSIGFTFNKKVTQQIFSNLTSKNPAYDKIDIIVELSGDFSDSQKQTVQISEKIEPVNFQFNTIPADSVITVNCKICLYESSTILYEGKSESIKIIADETQNVKIKLHSADFGLENLKPTIEIELTTDKADKSYSFVKIFDNLYLSDNSEKNYKNYSICKKAPFSDELIKFAISNWNSSYTVKLNDIEINVSEKGIIDLSQLLKNIKSSKNKIVILNGNEEIDYLEFDIENGFYDCLPPALLIKTIKGSENELGTQHLLSEEKTVRYGIPFSSSSTTSTFMVQIVQNDGSEYLKDLKFKINPENKELFTDDNNTFTFADKIGDYIFSITPDFSAEDKQYFTKEQNLSSKITFKARYVPNTEYAIPDMNKEQMSLYATNNPLNLTQNTIDIISDMNLGESSYVNNYCIDSSGKIWIVYYDNNTDEYKVIPKDTNIEGIAKNVTINSNITCDYGKNLIYYSGEYQDNNDFFPCITVRDASTGNFLFTNEYEPKPIILNSQNIIYEFIGYNMPFTVCDDYIFVPVYDYKLNTYKLVRQKFKITDTTEPVCSFEVLDEKILVFPEEIKPDLDEEDFPYLQISDIVAIGDELYILVTTKDECVFNEDYTKLNQVVRGCILKTNVDTMDKFEILGWNDKTETVTTSVPVYYKYYDGYYYGCLGSNDNYYSNYYKTPYNFTFNTTQISKTTSSLTFKNPRKFVAIKPKKLVVSDCGNFLYIDDSGLCFGSNSDIVEVDLEKFAITSSNQLSFLLQENNYVYEKTETYSSGTGLFTLTNHLNIEGNTSNLVIRKISIPYKNFYQN